MKNDAQTDEVAYKGNPNTWTYERKYLKSDWFNLVHSKEEIIFMNKHFMLQNIKMNE